MRLQRGILKKWQAVTSDRWTPGGCAYLDVQRLPAESPWKPSSRHGERRTSHSTRHGRKSGARLARCGETVNPAHLARIASSRQSFRRRHRARCAFGGGRSATPRGLQRSETHVGRAHPPPGALRPITGGEDGAQSAPSGAFWLQRQSADSFSKANWCLFLGDREFGCVLYRLKKKREVTQYWRVCEKHVCELLFNVIYCETKMTYGHSTHIWQMCFTINCFMHVCMDLDEWACWLGVAAEDKYVPENGNTKSFQ